MDKSFLYLDKASSFGISVVGCGQLYKEKPEHFLKERKIDCFGLSHIYEGSGVFESMGAGSFSVEAGDSFLLFPGDLHSYGPKPGGYWKELWIFFEGSLIRSLLKDGYLHSRTPLFKAHDTQKIFEMFNRTIEMALYPAEENHRRVPCLLFQILFVLVNFGQSSHSKRQENVIGSIVRNIVENPAAPIDFKTLAQTYGISYSLLRKRFTENTGMSPYRFVNKERIRLASRHLAEGSSVKETAVLVGMDDQYHFSRLFKQTTGVSPKEYARSVAAWSASSQVNPQLISDALKVTGFNNHEIGISP